MPAMHLFEYAVLRVVPRVEREEFLNVGVIVYCRSLGFLQARFELPEARLLALAPDVDLTEITACLQAFERICQGRAAGGTIGRLPIAERFRWLTAARSTVVQTSPVHPGRCADAAQTLARLHAQLVR
ncbi:DUF3037 domain-containing protein [Hymenobacter sp.]|uniref:DUF3037 domain-containing protein n=1 Tax=Hymenobacter sp. TaxID=1898978 RepID=UPI00286AE503|nr:DUF3037 domain-containing protein [Hymenobacter sp.]